MTELQQIIVKEINKQLLDHDMHIRHQNCGFNALLPSNDLLLLYLTQSNLSLSLLKDCHSISDIETSSGIAIALVCILTDVIIVIYEPIGIAEYYETEKHKYRDVIGMHIGICQPDCFQKIIDGIIGYRDSLGLVIMQRK